MTILPFKVTEEKENTKQSHFFQVKIFQAKVVTAKYCFLFFVHLISKELSNSQISLSFLPGLISFSLKVWEFHKSFIDLLQQYQRDT